MYKQIKNLEEIVGKKVTGVSDGWHNEIVIKFDDKTYIYFYPYENEDEGFPHLDFVMKTTIFIVFSL